MTVGLVSRFAFGGAVKAKGMARGGQARLPIGTKAIALQEHSPINNQKRAMRSPQTAMAKTPMDIMGSAPPEPDMPQMYGNAAKKRARRGVL